MKQQIYLFLAVTASFIAGCRDLDAGKAVVEDGLWTEVQRMVERREIPGAIGVLCDDGVEKMGVFGFADMEKKRPMTMDSAFMQCSQTKGFCAVTVAVLIEEGKVNLDDPISTYLPEFAELKVLEKTPDGKGEVVRPAKTVVTLRMCLNHTGGFAFELPNFTAMGGWSRRMPLRSVAAVAAGIPLLFEPGTEAEYSNVGIDIAAAIVEVVSGMRWERFLQTRVLDPLEMKETGFWPTECQLSGMIELYDIQDGMTAKWRNSNPMMGRPYSDDRVFPSAGAGLWTTARDQLKFYKMLMNLGLGENGTRILSEDTVKTLLARSSRLKGIRVHDKETVEDDYSLGLNAPQPEDDGENAWFGHGGAWGTICMVNWRRRRLKLWVAQLCGNLREWYAARRGVEDRFFKGRDVGLSGERFTGRTK